MNKASKCWERLFGSLILFPAKGRPCWKSNTFSWTVSPGFRTCKVRGCLCCIARQHAPTATSVRWNPRQRERSRPPTMEGCGSVSSISAVVVGRSGSPQRPQDKHPSVLGELGGFFGDDSSAASRCGNAVGPRIGGTPKLRACKLQPMQPGPSMEFVVLCHLHGKHSRTGQGQSPLNQMSSNQVANEAGGSTRLPPGWRHSSGTRTSAAGWTVRRRRWSVPREASELDWHFPLARCVALPAWSRICSESFSCVVFVFPSLFRGAVAGVAFHSIQVATTEQLVHGLLGGRVRLGERRWLEAESPQISCGRICSRRHVWRWWWTASLRSEVSNRLWTPPWSMFSMQWPSAQQGRSGSGSCPQVEGAFLPGVDRPQGRRQVGRVGVGGRWSTETRTFLSLLAHGRAR